MRIGKFEIKRRVWLGLASALVVTGVWWTTARNKPAAAVPAPAKQPFVRLAGAGTGAGDQVLREQAELLDPTPLFFPTEWNFGQRPLKESLRKQPGQIFGSFPPKVDFGEQGIKAYGIEPAAVPEQLADVLAQGNEAPFAGMGQIDVHQPALAERSGFLEVYDISAGKYSLKQALANVALPRPDFAPMEFLAVVSSAGMIGEPVLVRGSGWEEVDSFFRSYLVKVFRLGERLSPGRYRVLVGP
ncbi:MAG: hypothetical protein HYV75_03475 [Opitutae bacterium]|nr:hypothetical protein [Opitutae bacterium]